MISAEGNEVGEAALLLQPANLNQTRCFILSPRIFLIQNELQSMWKTRFDLRIRVSKVFLHSSEWRLAFPKGSA